ncbi:hypothetical protein ACQP2P_25470 [Dactylosporangium sp. CA-139114]|uniref:hypothetical protein n=1 Tax=Dactylosporangium sp. CA-139114 TaxID=3239931 RepID=UPI003D986305
MRTIGTSELTFLTADEESSTLVVQRYAEMASPGIRARQPIDATTVVPTPTMLVPLVTAPRIVSPTPLLPCQGRGRLTCASPTPGSSSPAPAATSSP